MNVNKEHKRLFDYFINGVTVPCSGDKVLLNSIGHNFNSAQSYERPDILIPIGEQIVAIEHFEFDASSVTRKGSKDKKNQDQRDKEFSKKIDFSDLKNEPLILSCCNETEYLYKNYIKNFFKAFENHYEKIKKYKLNLISNDLVKNEENIIMCFFIEDTTPLGTYYLEEGMLKTLDLFLLKEYLDIISRSVELDCVFYGNYCGNRLALSFMKISQFNIEYLKQKKLIDFTKDEFFTFKPKESRFAINLD